jgi:hypothetical protein
VQATAASINANVFTETASSDCGTYRYAIEARNPSSPLNLILEANKVDCCTNNVYAWLNNVIDVGSWYHLAMTYDATAGTYDVYINGVLVDSSTQSKGTIGTGNHGGVIGGNWNICASQNPFAGKIDDFRIYDRVLGAGEVQRLYQVTGG